MQASYAGPLAGYNSLEDEHLAEYFSNPLIIRHLRKMGLVTKDGRIVSESTIRRTTAQEEHKARTKNVLAESIVRNAVELERKRRAVIKKKLEQLAKIEMVQKIRSQKSHPPWIQEFNPQALQHSFCVSLPSRLSATLETNSERLGLTEDQLFEMRRMVGEITKDRSVRARRHSPYEPKDWSRSTTPLPLAPRPPSAPRPVSSMPTQNRRLQLTHQNGRPRTAPVGESRPFIRSRSEPVRSNVQITLKYIGKSLHLEGYHSTSPSEVLILQQHCGGNTVPLYKGMVRARELFTFESKRHLGMPFGLTIYLDGMMDSRVSACCEYRHQVGRVLGSKTAHFRLIKVNNGRPCPKCTAEIEEKEKKDKLQKSLEEAISNSSPNENDEELNQLLARNGIIEEQTHSPSVSAQSSQPQMETQESETEESPELERPVSLEPEPKQPALESEVQATEDIYEDDFARSQSEVSIESQHSSLSSTRSVKEQRKSSSQSHSQSSSASSISSISTANSTPNVQQSSPQPEIKPTHEDTVEQSDSDNKFEEPDVPRSIDNSDKATIDGEDSFKESLPQESSPLQEKEIIAKSSEPLEIGKGSTHELNKTPSDDNGTITSPDVTKVHTAIENTGHLNTLGTTGSTEESSTVEVSNNQPKLPGVMNKVVAKNKIQQDDEAESSLPTISERQEATARSEKSSSNTLLPESTKNSPASSDLSPSQTLNEAVEALKKSPSANSLDSILNDNPSKAASSVNLSEADEDIPDIEKKIVELSNPNLLATTEQPSDTKGVPSNIEVSTIQDKVEESQEKVTPTHNKVNITQNEVSPTQDEVNITQDEVNKTQDEGTPIEVILTQDEVNTTQDEVTPTENEVTNTKDEVSMAQDQQTNNDTKISEDVTEAYLEKESPSEPTEGVFSSPLLQLKTQNSVELKEPTLVENSQEQPLIDPPANSSGVHITSDNVQESSEQKDLTNGDNIVSEKTDNEHGGGSSVSLSSSSTLTSVSSQHTEL